MRRSIYITLLCLLPAACGRPAADEPVVDIYNWYDYVKPQVLHEFTARYGIQVHYNTFDSNNTLEARMLAGHSGYDVVFPSGAYLENMVKAGVFRPLDVAELPNLANMDATIMQRLAAHDSGNAHAVVYAWELLELPTTRPRSERGLQGRRRTVGRCCLIRRWHPGWLTAASAYMRLQISSCRACS